MSREDIPLNGGWDDETMALMGYVWCRAHTDYHRLPECAVDESGQPLMPCGCPFDLPEHHKQECDLWQTPTWLATD